MLMTLQELNTEIVKYIMPSQLDSIDWSHLTEQTKTAALNRANKQMNRLMFIGVKADESQEDSWPRLIFEEVVQLPDDCKAAICEYVFEYIHIYNDSTFESLRSGITNEKVGPVSITYDKSVLDLYNNKYQEYLVDWLYRGAGE